MRTALLPAGPDPYLIAYWLRNYATWADSVDRLHIIVCAQTDQTAKAFIRDRANAVPHAFVSFLDERTAHGTVIELLMEGCKDGLVVLCEDDAFVQQPAVIGECFERIESGAVDLVGTPRMYGSYALFDRAAELWGERVAALSPAFLFARLADLRRVVPTGTSEHQFGSTHWLPGTRIEALDMVAEDDLVADTFVAASFQLRAMGLRIETRTSYRSAEARPDGTWFHVGSLSDGYGCAFLGPDDLRRGKVKEALTDPTDWYKRVAWWRRVHSLAGDGPIEMWRAYGTALNRFVADAHLPNEVIEWSARAITPLVTWAER